MTDLHYWTIAPQLVVLGTAVLVLVVSMLIPARTSPVYTVVGAAGLAAAGVWLAKLSGYQATAFGSMIVVDGFSTALQLAIVVGALLSVLIASGHLSRHPAEHGGDYISVLLFAAYGMMLLATSNDFVMVFLAIEVMSIAVYILAGFARRRETSIEASLKYLITGGFASAFLLYGIALLYGATGTTNLTEIRTALGSSGFGNDGFLAMLGTGFLIVGLAFKIGGVPFHMWAPDVYQGAPTPVTAFMSIGVKAAAVGAMARVMLDALSPLTDRWFPVLQAIAILTMVGGNVLALNQKDLKRLLAYSSIAHAGYLMVGICAAARPGAGNNGTAGILFYLLTYAATTAGAFAVIIAIQPEGKSGVTFDDLRGLSRRHPVLAFLLTIFMLSMAGIPPLAGFAGKFYLFAAAVQSKLYTLAITGILASVVGVYYYLKVVSTSYFDEPEKSAASTQPAITPALAAGIVLSLILCVELGISAIPATGAMHASYFEAIRSTLQALF